MNAPDDPLDMKADWNRRAVENARFYIATTHWQSEAEFDASGARDVALFFEGLDHVLGPSRVALDIGCGIGRMDRHVAPRVGRLIGVDVAGEMVVRARQRLADLRNVEFLECDGRTLPVDDASVDLVFSHVTFQHMPFDVFDGYLAEVARVLREGGHFVFQVPEALVDAPPQPPRGNTFDVHFHRETEIREKLERLGFTYEACRRFRIETPEMDLDFLRICARR